MVIFVIMKVDAGYIFSFELKYDDILASLTAHRYFLNISYLGLT